MNQSQNIINTIFKHSPIKKSELDVSNEELMKLDLVNDLGFDSMALINLIVDLEYEFSINFDDEILLRDNLSINNLCEFSKNSI